MRWIIPAFFAFSCFCLPACAQDNPAGLVEEAASLLKNNKTGVSGILADKKYLPVHPQTSFRDLIRDHANTEVLSITEPGEPGKKIKVLGRITDNTGRPVAGALVYLYQTDAKGWYSADSPHVGGNEGDMRQARLFGYVKTDEKGRFELHTIKPSGYPKSDLPAHIHIHVWKEGFRNFVNEFLFDDDERLVGEIRTESERNKFMIAKPEPAEAPFEQQFTYHFILSK